MKKFSVTLLFLLSTQAFSFVENVTHGYPNCLACHVSPTGGGILTDYGRALSSELMSTWKTESFNQPLGGLIKNSETLKWGGDIRAIQTHFENNEVKSGSLFVMQKNIELAAYIEDFVAVTTVGTKEGPKNRVQDQGEFLSERHYIMYQGDQTSRIRLGKFRQNYGLNDPNHRRFVKDDLGFGSYSETYQMEYFKILEGGELLLSTSLGRIDVPRDTNERNILGQYTTYVNGKSRLTGNILLGESPSQRRSLIGGNGVFSLFSDHDIFRFDLNYSITQDLTQAQKGEKRKGIFSYFLYGYKIYDGLFPYFIYEHKQTDLSQSRLTMTQSPGLGLQFFPLSHLEIQLEYQYRVNQRTKKNPEHRSFLLFHVYL